MSGVPALAGRRYALEYQLEGGRPIERHRGFDRKLGRSVLVWSTTLPEDAPERRTLLATARAIARADLPHCLRVLDIVPERDRLAVVVEAPPDDAPASDQPLDAARAVAVALAAGETIEARIGAQLPVHSLDRDYVYISDPGGTALDPIGVFLPRDADEELPAPGSLLIDLLDSLAGDDATAPDDALRAFVARWSHAGSADLPAILDELRTIAGAPRPPVRVSPPPVSPERALSTPLVEETVPLDTWPGSPVAAATAAPAAPPTRAQRRTLRWTIAVPVLAVVFAASLGLVGLVVALQSPGDPTQSPSSGDSPAPPVQTPAPGRVTVGLTAQEDSTVRVTVDGVVEFDGTLRAGQRQLWEGSERIQVWTDSGRTLLLSVNGQDLGPYSPAMGHPEWNRIDFGFWPGWSQ